jgi:hypothetical protein
MQNLITETETATAAYSEQIVLHYKLHHILHHWLTYILASLRHLYVVKFHLVLRAGYDTYAYQGAHI